MKKLVGVLMFLLTLGTLNPFSYAEETWERLDIDVRYLDTIEITPWGIVAGELDSRIWLNPYNGVYFSSDLGQTWTALGLQGSGVKDLDYFNNKIYAAAYYVQNNQRGLFVSEDVGNTWQHIGPNYSPTSIDRNSACIYMGTEHNGLQISCDEGNSWNAAAIDETKIKKVVSYEDIVLVSGINRVYKSHDDGRTWDELTYFTNQDFTDTEQIGDALFIGNSAGLYRSVDTGITWEKINNYQILQLENINNKLVISTLNPLTLTTDILVSEDYGTTWKDTFLNMHQQYKILDLASMFAKDFHILALSLTQGIYKYNLTETIDDYPFMNLPWNIRNSNDLVDNITAYFDHQYPLLGYKYHQEPSAENDTTLNYLGKKEKIPILYYSSHSGTDFGLKYGTEILAPASGFATYYYCKDCGHSIKINHQNGYTTTYMHLQKDSLITLNTSTPIWVDLGDIIGKVGMTGRTTGPHLHFEVSQEGNFPDKRVDPFGWQARIQDPWALYSWIDTLGEHTGAVSRNLWNTPVENVESFDTETITHVIGNKEFEYNPVFPSTFVVSLRGNPKETAADTNLEYLQNSAFYIDVYNQDYSPIGDGESCVKMKLNIENINISNILKETLSFYHYNSVSNNWDKVSSILNLALKFIEAETCNYSMFAVFGEKVDPENPVTFLMSNTESFSNWLSYYPVVELSSGGAGTSIFYKMSYLDDWKIYSEPITIDRNGITRLLYRAQDIHENIEETKSQIIKINILSKQVDKIKAHDAVFKVNFE